MLDHFLVRISGSELRIRFHIMRQPPGLIPARFPKIGRTGSFRLQSVGKSGWGVGSTRNVPGLKIKTEILL
jgi:hypothetical protein